MTFSCLGATGCGPTRTVSAEGAGQVVTGTASDGTGHTRMTVDLDLDRTPAVVTSNLVEGRTYVLGAVPKPTCAASDALSGLVGTCLGVVSGGTKGGVGDLSYRAGALDRAGNIGYVVVHYRVVYGWNGFSPPITVRGTPASVKAGSSLPLPFTLTDAAGKVVRTGSAPRFVTPAGGGPTSAPFGGRSAAVPASGSAPTFTVDKNGRCTYV